MAENIMLTTRAEEYLEAVLNMKIEGKKVHAVRLAERLSVSPPTVAAALKRLVKLGLIKVNSKKEIELTEHGEHEALKIVRRHRLIELLLTDILLVDWSECHKEACRLEHSVTSLVENKLSERLGNPSMCPHGNPIPQGKMITLPQGTQLSEIAKGTMVDIVRISEEATLNLELMRFFQKHGILPGKNFLVKEVILSAGTITLEGKNSEVSIGTKAASAIWVK